MSRKLDRQTERESGYVLTTRLCFKTGLERERETTEPYLDIRPATKAGNPSLQPLRRQQEEQNCHGAVTWCRRNSFTNMVGLTLLFHEPYQPTCTWRLLKHFWTIKRPRTLVMLAGYTSWTGAWQERNRWRRRNPSGVWYGYIHTRPVVVVVVVPDRFEIMPFFPRALISDSLYSVEY